MLVDNREGQTQGRGHAASAVRQAARGQRGQKLPDRFKNYRVTCRRSARTRRERQENYSDPLAADPEGGDYSRRWLARMEPVRFAAQDTGWIVIVQEAYDTAIGDTLDKLTREPDPLRPDRPGADRAGDGRPVGNGEAAEYEWSRMNGVRARHHASL